MIMMIFAAALAAATPAAPEQPADTHAGHSQPGDAGGHKEMDCCKHMKADKTADCCKDMPDAEKAKCCAERAAGHAEHHKK